MQPDGAAKPRSRGWQQTYDALDGGFCLALGTLTRRGRETEEADDTNPLRPTQVGDFPAPSQPDWTHPYPLMTGMDPIIPGSYTRSPPLSNPWCLRFSALEFLSFTSGYCISSTMKSTTLITSFLIRNVGF